MRDNVRRTEMPTPGPSASAALSLTRRESSDMLAPLGFYLLALVIACTMFLLVCWAFDTAEAETETGRPRPADSGFFLDSIPYEWRQPFASMDDTGFGEELSWSRSSRARA